MCSKGDRRLITSKQCELGENFGAKPSNFQAENDWLQSLLTGQEAPEAGKKYWVVPKTRGVKFMMSMQRQVLRRQEVAPLSLNGFILMN